MPTLNNVPDLIIVTVPNGYVIRSAGGGAGGYETMAVAESFASLVRQLKHLTVKSALRGNRAPPG